MRAPLLRPLRQLWALTRVEALRLLRTEQIYRYVLLPALLLVPAVLAISLMVATFFEEPTVVALPTELPPQLDLVSVLEDEHLVVQQVADPAATWDEGEVDAAILAWREGDGIGRARAPEPSGRARWVFEVAAVDEELHRQLEDALDEAGNHWLQDLVAASGGEPERGVRVALVRPVGLDEDAPFDVERFARAYALFTIGMVAFFFLSLTGVADRREGVTESLRVLPVPPVAMLWARVLAVLALQLLASLLLLLNFVLLFHNLGEGVILPPLTWSLLPSFSAGLLLVDALYAVLGVLTTSAKAANNAASVVILAVLLLLYLGVQLDLPAWTPLAGFVAASTWSAHLQATVGSALVAILVLGASARAMQRRVDLVLPRGDE